RVLGFHVSADFFTALGVTPALGRTFRADEETRGRDAVVVLSDGLWRRRFGADASIVGQSIPVDGATAQVVGIAPPGFSFPMSAEIWAPLSSDPATPPSRTAHGLTVFGRLAAGVGMRQAGARVVAEGQRLARDYPVEDGKRGMRLYTLRGGMADLGLPP